MLFDVKAALAEILNSLPATSATFATRRPSERGGSQMSRMSQSQPGENGNLRFDEWRDLYEERAAVAEMMADCPVRKPRLWREQKWSILRAGNPYQHIFPPAPRVASRIGVYARDAPWAAHSMSAARGLCHINIAGIDHGQSREEASGSCTL